MYILAQIVGIIAGALCILSFQQNKHKNIIALQLSGGIAFTIHFILLGAYTGAAMNLIDILRSIVFINRGKKWADHIWWVFVFSGLCVLSCILTWIGPLSLLPMGAMILTTISFYLQSPKLVRRVALPASPLWIIYNIATKSLGGIITEAFNICSIIIAMFRHDFKSKEK